jgi:hypothetical protein
MQTRHGVNSRLLSTRFQSCVETVRWVTIDGNRQLERQEVFGKWR